ncbi:hypothetical protein GIB67_040252 [Kingdonia uniflora]|uniref:Uncharacterized protein n=1 Tax=Kingdonia uniflora TaxID=39325 RepID=A0A7J7MVL7_9MAGN|nr:hypothetical protein GIB67_040252 [Kingdonia uniflora]
MASISGCAKVDEADLLGHLSPVIGVGDKEDTVAELIEWPRLKGSRVEYPTGFSQFREFCKAKSSIDGIWGHAFAYRGNFFRTCSVSQGGDYLYLQPDLAKEKKCRHLGDEVSLEYVQGVVKDSRTDGFCFYLEQFDYGLTLPLSNLAKGVMILIGVCPAQLNCNFWEVIFVCETLNGRWAASGSEKRITAKDFLEYYAVKYVTTTNSAYLYSSSARTCFFDLSSGGRVWNDNLLWVSSECLQWSDEEPLEVNNRTIIKGKNESFIDVVAKEGTELEAVLKELEISRFKRVASKDDKVRRSQAKRRLVGKTPGSMEEKLITYELNIPLKLARLNEILDGPVDMATVSSTVVQNLAKRKAIKRGAASCSVSSVSVGDNSKRRKGISPTKSQVMLEESDKIAEGADLRPYFEVKADLLEEQCRAKAREKMVAVMDNEFKKFARTLKDVQLGSQDRSMELEKKISQLEGEKNQLEEKLTRERVDFQLEREKEKEAVALKLKQVRPKSEAEAEQLVTASAISRNNLEVEEREGGLNTADKTDANNQKTINQEIENSRLRVVDLEGLLEVGKKSSVELQYEDRLDDNVKLSLKLEEAKSQVEDKTATLLSRDLALNQLLSELVELKERAASGSRHDAELAEYRIRALNDKISDMKYNIRAMNEQLLKREIDLDTARTNLAMSEADFEKLSSIIVGKDLELRNSVQIRDSLIAKFDRLKADLCRLKEREAKNRANLVERELRAREMKYEKDLKLELVKRDYEIAYGEGNREMKEFLHRKEELVENMRIDLANSRQKSINLTRKMSERIDQLTTELPKSKARYWKDNKRATVTHQAFKELVVHEQEKCDREAWHQRQLSALVAFFVGEIKFLQVERDLIQDCFSGRTCICELDISIIDPIGVMDRGIGTTTDEHIARGKEIVAERALEYMPPRTEIGGRSSVVSPTPVVGGRSSVVSPTLVVGGRSTALPSRKPSRVKRK